MPRNAPIRDVRPTTTSLVARVLNRVVKPAKAVAHHPHVGNHHPAGTAGDAVAPRHHGPVGKTHPGNR